MKFWNRKRDLLIPFIRIVDWAFAKAEYYIKVSFLAFLDGQAYINREVHTAFETNCRIVFCFWNFLRKSRNNICSVPQRINSRKEMYNTGGIRCGKIKAVIAAFAPDAAMIIFGFCIARMNIFDQRAIKIFSRLRFLFWNRLFSEKTNRSDMNIRKSARRGLCEIIWSVRPICFVIEGWVKITCRLSGVVTGMMGWMRSAVRAFGWPSLPPYVCIAVSVI